MPTAYSANVVQVQLNGTYLLEEVQNTLWFQTNAPPQDASQRVSLATNLETWWTNEMRPLVSSSYSLREIAVLSWASGTAPVHIRALSPPLSGANVQTVVPGNVACCVTFRTDGRGRSSRGRNYVAGITESMISGNQFTVAASDAFRAAYAELIVGATIPGWDWVVYSQWSNKLIRPTGLAQFVTAVTVDRNVDSMRRRLAGRGR